MDEPVYKTIAVASTFSPRFLRVISEAKRVRDRFNSRLSLIYVGEHDAETAREFSDALAEQDLPAASTVHYKPGHAPAEATREPVQTH